MSAHRSRSAAKHGSSRTPAPSGAAHPHDAVDAWPAAVLTVSDRCARGEVADRSGAFLVDALREHGFRTGPAEIVPDDPLEITRALMRFADVERARLILTTGGTGLSPRDVTPEATRPLLEREAPGIAEALRSTGLRQTAHSMLSRGLAGSRGATLIVNLPGSESAVRESFATLAPVLAHTLRLLGGAPATPAEHRPDEHAEVETDGADGSRARRTRRRSSASS